LNAPEAEHQHLVDLCPDERAQVEPILPRLPSAANLSQLSEETGGEAYYLGWPSRHIEPYFDELGRIWTISIF